MKRAYCDICEHHHWRYEPHVFPKSVSGIDGSAGVSDGGGVVSEVEGGRGDGASGDPDASGVGGGSEVEGKFDRGEYYRKYMREYMRKRRSRKPGIS